MNTAKLIHDGRRYNYDSSTNIEMEILGYFFENVACRSVITYREWALNDPDGCIRGNITALDQEDGCIYLSDIYSQEWFPTRLKMSIEQFVKLLDDWEQKVCKVKPQEVIIKYEGDQFIIETKEESSL